LLLVSRYLVILTCFETFFIKIPVSQNSYFYVVGTYFKDTLNKSPAVTEERDEVELSTYQSPVEYWKCSCLPGGSGISRHTDCPSPSFRCCCFWTTPP